jgi:hypothetical protein
LAHILAPFPEPSAVNTGNDFIARTTSSDMLFALGFKLFYAGHLIQRRAIIARDFRFNNHGRIDLIRDAEIGRLPEVRYSFSSSSFSVSYASPSEPLLNRVFHHLTNQFGNSIPMTSKRATKIPLVE